MTSIVSSFLNKWFPNVCLLHASLKLRRQSRLRCEPSLLSVPTHHALASPTAPSAAAEREQRRRPSSRGCARVGGCFRGSRLASQNAEMFPFIKLTSLLADFPPAAPRVVRGWVGLVPGAQFPGPGGLKRCVVTFLQEVEFYKSHPVFSLSLHRRLTSVAEGHSV